MSTLATYFSLQDFISFFKKDFSQISETEKTRVGKIVRDYFLSLVRGDILIVPEDNFNNHENIFLGAVKRVINGDPATQEDLNSFTQFLMFQIAGAFHFPGTLDAQYKNFIECVDNGEFFDIDFPRSDVCTKCGATLALGAEDWIFSAHAYKEERKEDGTLHLEHERHKFCTNKH